MNPERQGGHLLASVSGNKVQLTTLSSEAVETGRSPERWTSLGAQTVKNPHAMPEIRVQSLGWEDPLEKGIPTPVFLPAKSMDRRAW